MKHIQKIIFAAVVFSLIASASAFSQSRAYYQFKIYHITRAQEQRVDRFLKDAYIPALHRAGIKTVGVFKPIKQDTTDIKVYVFIPFKSLDQFENLNQTLAGDNKYKADGKEYLNSAWDDINYKRIESVILRAFPNMPQPEVPKLSAAKKDRIYELRSYESATESLAAAKVKQFNAGGEIKIFKKLNFNAVFYGEVLSGPRMPNLMYLTTHNSMAERDANWVAFNADPEWKVSKDLPEYQHTVSKSDVILTYPTDYSDF